MEIQLLASRDYSVFSPVVRPVRHQRWRKTAVGLFAATLLSTGALAATFTWNVDSGSWHAAESWSEETAPISNTAGNIITLTNGTPESPVESTLAKPDPKSNTWILSSPGSITIGANNTLTLADDVTLFTNGSSSVPSTLTNNGVIQASSTSGKLRAYSDSITNAGTLQALSGGTLTFWDVRNITNTSGTVLAKAGSMIQYWGNAALTGGKLETEVGGHLLNDSGGNVNQALTLTGVVVNNAGTFTNNQNTTHVSPGIPALIQTVLGTSTVFNNLQGATIELLNSGSGTSTNDKARNSLFNVNSGSTFNNAGTLLIQNDATRDGLLLGQTTTFSVHSGATAFSNTGTIQVIANTTATGATAVFTSAQTLTNDGIVHIKGNANGDFATLSVTGTGNDYLQSAGSGRRTVLEQGGKLIVADQVLIQGGTFGGVGTVTGATTIDGGATLIVGDTLAGAGAPGAGVLTFNQTLTLATGSDVKFGLGLNSAGSGSITLAGAANLTVGTDVTLTLNDLTGGNWESGTTYRLFNVDTGSIGGTSFVVNVVPAGWQAEISTGAGGTDFLDVTLTMVPEPSTYAMLGGGLAMLGALMRRRRHAQTA